MGLQMNILCYFVSTLFVTVGLAQPAHAQSSINDLMNDLNSSGPVEAKRLSREIERLWSQSGSVSIDLLLRRGREATEAGDFDVAIEHLTAVTDHAPNFAEGYPLRFCVVSSVLVIGTSIRTYTFFVLEKKIKNEK